MVGEIFCNFQSETIEYALYNLVLYLLHIPLQYFICFAYYLNNHLLLCEILG